MSGAAETSRRWLRRPDGSNWGDYGADDEYGRLNDLGPEQLLKGIAEVREGRSFLLSLPLDLPGGTALNPRRLPPRLFAVDRGGEPTFNLSLPRSDGTWTDIISDDIAQITLQYSTQWDGLSHVGGLFDADGDGVAEKLYYNGWKAGEHVCSPSAEPPFEGSRARRLGIERMAERCVQGRAVMIDLRAHFGDRRILVGMDELETVMRADDVVVEKGDMLCLHTGLADMILSMGGEPDGALLHNSCAVLDGRDTRLREWIRESGLVALIADNFAVEAVPASAGGACCAALPLHELCLFHLGVHLGELWRLTELADWLRAAGRSRFLLTAPPLNLPGAVGSPVSPVATV